MHTYDGDIDEVLIAEDAIAVRIQELADRISADYADRELLLVGVLKGAAILMSDLARALSRPVTMEFMAVSSYGSSTSSSGIVRILKDLDRDISGQHVLVVEDIVDSADAVWLLRNSPPQPARCGDGAAAQPAAVKVECRLRYLASKYQRGVAGTGWLRERTGPAYTPVKTEVTPVGSRRPAAVVGQVAEAGVLRRPGGPVLFRGGSPCEPVATPGEEGGSECRHGVSAERMDRRAFQVAWLDRPRRARRHRGAPLFGGNGGFTSATSTALAQLESGNYANVVVKDASRSGNHAQQPVDARKIPRRTRRVVIRIGTCWTRRTEVRDEISQQNFS